MEFLVLKGSFLFFLSFPFADPSQSFSMNPYYQNHSISFLFLLFSVHSLFFLFLPAIIKAPRLQLETFLTLRIHQGLRAQNGT